MRHKVSDMVMIHIATGADFVGNRLVTIVEHSGMSPNGITLSGAPTWGMPLFGSGKARFGHWKHGRRGA